MSVPSRSVLRVDAADSTRFARSRGTVTVRSAVLRGTLLLGSALLLAACEPAADDAGSEAAATAPESASGRISYGAGFAMADNLRGQLGEDFDGSAFAQGVRDAVDGRDSIVDEAALTAARDEIVARRQAAAEEEAQVNLQAAQAFLAENAEREGVTRTESGLQYEVMKEGSGATPVATDVVVTHYTGRLADGTVFDSSEARGEPATFGLDRVIPGWTEALQLMQVGDRWRLWLPPELAYGTRSPSEEIPPNAMLEFEVELLDVNPDAEEDAEAQ